MGDQAYLLFVFDKLIMQVRRNSLLFFSVTSFWLFRHWKICLSSRRATNARGTFSFSSNLVRLRTEGLKTSISTWRNSSSKCSKYKTSNLFQIDDIHSNWTELYCIQIRSVNNFNGTCIRLLYSPTSGVLCLHMFNLSPFVGLSTGNNSNNQGTQTLASFKQMDSHKAKLLK